MIKPPQQQFMLRCAAGSRQRGVQVKINARPGATPTLLQRMNSVAHSVENTYE
jgi:hypothetical protein